MPRSWKVAKCDICTQAHGEDLTRCARTPIPRVSLFWLGAARCLSTSSQVYNQPSTEPIELPSAPARSTTPKALNASFVQARASLAHYLYDAAAASTSRRVQALKEFYSFLMRSKQNLDKHGKTDMTIDLSVIDSFLRAEDAQIRCASVFLILLCVLSSWCTPNHGEHGQS